MHTRFIGIISSAVFALAACGGGSSSAPAPAGSAPDAPTSLLAVAGNAQASVVFTAPGNTGSSAITGYRVVSNPAGGVDRDAGSSTLNHVVTGLANGVDYTFTVTATNTAGTSAASGASNRVTPGLPTQWNTTGSLQTARYAHTATLLANGKVLVVGGFNMQGNGESIPMAAAYLTSAELYDPATRLWTSAGTLAIARPGHTATLLSNGKVLVTGGYASTADSSSSVVLYDPSANAWSAGSAMAEARYAHVASLLPSGKVMVVGGFGLSSAFPGAELYDPSTNTWAAAARPAIALSRGLSATLLPNGKLLCIQGYKQGFATSDTLNAEIYDPATNAWTPAGALTVAHDEHTATLLPNGTLAVIGGGYTSVHSATTYATNVTEVYDPVAKTWSLGSPLSMGGLVGHTATLLRSGAVLVVGGTAASGWWYQPSRAGAALLE